MRSRNLTALYPNDTTRAQSRLLKLRHLIFETAAKTEGVGYIFETLKWNQPAYLTLETKSGSTIRLGIPKTGGFAIYIHRQTTIMSDFQSIFPHEFAFEGNRAVHFQSGAKLPIQNLEFLIHRALTYHYDQTPRSMGWAF